MITRITPLIFRFLGTAMLLLTATAQAAIEKSPNDKRQYHGFTLPNQMKVLVISDPDTDKAAASLDLNIGTSANPEDRQGLAHFLEHMLFLGTEKYPEADSYQAFISQNGGSHNAYTAFENTNYFFDIKAAQLEPALDRFAHFFIDPLFTEAYVDRERHAVHSEYQSKLRDDGRRSFSATKQIMNPEHPYSQFAVGSLETLSNQDGDLRRDLLEFYNRYYSANLMTLVILGREPVEQLQAMATEKFSAVKNRSVTAPVTPVPVLKDLPLQLNIQTVKDIRQLKLTFPIPAVRPFYREKPAYYIASMLGYEGKGSLFSVLKEQGLANSLSAYGNLDLPDQSSISLSIGLTEAGYRAYDKVIAAAFSAIRLLQSEGISAAMYREEQQISALQFRYKEASQPIHYVGHLARNLQFYPLNEVISADYSMADFAPGLIDSILDHMIPENVLVTLLSQTVETDQTDPWFNASYSVQGIAASRLQAWQNPPSPEGLALRQANPFIAGALALKSDTSDSRPPALLTDQQGRALWHKLDTSFGVPKADFWFTVITDKARESAASAAMTKLFTDLLKDSLNETLYDASLAGLNTRIYSHMQGFSIRISGYNDKQAVLLQALLSKINSASFSDADFQRIKARYTRELENSLQDKPYNQAISAIYTLLMQSWSTDDKLQALSGITLQQLHDFIPALLANTEIRMLANGNLTASEARAMAGQVIAALPGNPSFSGRSEMPVVLLPQSERLTQTLPLQHNDSAISLYFQGPDSDIDTRAAYALLSEIMSAPFYSKLRTEKQLGYVVFGTPLPLRNAPGLAFVVQSPNTDPMALEQHIDQFLADMGQQLREMPDDQLSRYKDSVISRINRQATRLSERTSRYWQAIDRNDRQFNNRARLTRAIAGMTRDSLQSVHTALPQHCLTVRSFGEQHQQSASAEDLQQVSDQRITALKHKGRFVPGA